MMLKDKQQKMLVKLLDLDVKRIINEPTAAALAYGLDKKTRIKKLLYMTLVVEHLMFQFLNLVMVYLKLNQLMEILILVVMILMNIIIDCWQMNLKKMKVLILRKDPMALQRLKEAAEKAKIELSSSTQQQKLTSIYYC